jgi:hypothetical protein
MVCDIMSRRLNCRNMQRYGRSGQEQYGVDIVGLTKEGVIGIQCKNFLKKKLTTATVDQELEKCKTFTPTLSRCYLVTCVDKDSELQSYVYGRAIEHQAQQIFDIEIIFWEDLTEWLESYPDVRKKYYPHFPDPEELNYSLENDHHKLTLTYPVEASHLQTTVIQTMNDLPKNNVYQFTLGLTTFPNVYFDKVADLQLLLADIVAEEDHFEASFEAVAQIFTEVKALLSDRDFYSNELWIYPNVRLSFAFLFGSVFRKVTGFRLKLIANHRIWATYGLAEVPSDIVFDLPITLNETSREVAVVLNISSNIEISVEAFVRSWEIPPRWLHVWSLPDNNVKSAAHGLSIARDIARHFKRLITSAGVLHIHVFPIMPAALALLIAYHLNGICPISVYFMDGTRDHYRIGGTVFNDTGGKRDETSDTI